MLVSGTKRLELTSKLLSNYPIIHSYISKTLGLFQMCFEWFTKGLSDLDPDTQSQLFQKELLHIDPTKLTPKGKWWTLYLEFRFHLLMKLQRG